MTLLDRAKQAAAKHAIDAFVKDGMTLGLGSGSTANWFLRLLGERIESGLTITGVPSSQATRDLAREVGIALVDLNDIVTLDLCVDGADEIDAEFRMIKGGGACLTREKIVAQASSEMVVLIDDSKLVMTLGKFPLPIEVAPFGWQSTRQHIVDTFAEHEIRDAKIEMRGGESDPLITDNQNYILDCHLKRIDYANMLTSALNTIPGVVENGLFVREANAVIIGREDGTAHTLTKTISEL